MALPELTIEEVEYQYAHQYDTKEQWILGNIAISLLCAIIAVILRFVARKKRGIRLAWNDYMIVFSLVRSTLSLGGASHKNADLHHRYLRCNHQWYERMLLDCHDVLIFTATSLGLGYHVVIVGKDKGIEVAKMLAIAEMLFPIAGSTIRLSVLMFYVQVFGTSIRWFWRGVQLVGLQWILLMLAGFFCTVLQCVPLKLAWTSNHAERCLDIEKMVMSLTIYAIFLNFATLFLPLPLIMKLKLNWRKKIGISALFALAGG